MPELAHKQTADMDRDGLHYSSNDHYYRIGRVHTCKAEIVTQHLARRQLVAKQPRPLPRLSPLELARMETDDLTNGLTAT